MKQIVSIWCSLRACRNEERGTVYYNVAAEDA